MARPEIEIGDAVSKTGGDYTYVGEVVAVFQKRGGAWRLVVEDIRGLLLIMNPKQVEKLDYLTAAMHERLGGPHAG